MCTSVAGETFASNKLKAEQKAYVIVVGYFCPLSVETYFETPHMSSLNKVVQIRDRTKRLMEIRQKDRA